MESRDCLSRLSRIRESRLRSSASSRAHRSAAATLPTGRSLRGVNRKTRHATSRKISPFSPDPGREHRTNIIPSRHDRQSDHADCATPGHFHPNMTWCGTRRNNGERRRMTKRCKMAVPINQRWPHQRMLRRTSHCVAEPLPHNADLGHFRAGVAMRSSFRSQRDNTRAQ